MLLREIGVEGLREHLQAERSREMQSLALESVTLGAEPGRVNRQGGDGGLPRKVNARARLLVDAQQHLTLLRSYVAAYYTDDKIRGEVLRFVDRSKNLQRMVVNRIAVAYTVPPARMLRNVDPDEAAVFAKAYRDGGVDQLAEQWNRYVCFLSVVHVLPRYEHDGLKFVTLLPSQCDALRDNDDREPSILVFESECHGASLVAVDRERWLWLDKSWNVVAEEEHSLGMRPWVTFRKQAPPDFDYWDTGAGQDLYDATMEIGRVAAHMRWVRHNWSKKLHRLHLGENVTAPANQNMAANQPIVTRGDGDTVFEVHDTIVGMTEFLAQMREIVESLLENHGLPSNAVDFNTDSTKDASNVFGPAKLNLHDALSKLRNQQVKHFEAAELELAVRAIALLRKHGQLRITDEEVRANFRARFVPLTFADHPKERVATAKEQVSVGLIDYYEFYMQENPGTTYEEAQEYVDANFATSIRLMSELASHNATLDPDKGLQTAAQINGSIGGERSGVVRAADSENPS